MHILLPDLDATRALAGRLANLLRTGDAILLYGSLGAGKSELARSLIRKVTNDPWLDVPSPSYTLVQTYDTPLGPLSHFDLWRLDGPAAVEELGWNDALDGIVVVEWADRLGALRPRDALMIELSLEQGQARSATMTGWAERLP